jgi:hypothetical protein
LFYYCLITRNRIALLQKEEERARKKIEQTKERAMEILVMRTANEKRVQDYVKATGKQSQHQRELQSKAKETDYEMRRQRAEQLESLHSKRREEVIEMQQERRISTKVMLKDQEKDLRMKQMMREEVRKKEEESRFKRDQEKLENDRRIKEAYEQRAAVEAAEAKRAEKLVKSLEKKEREWMMKLRETQTVQETAFEQLETALSGQVLDDYNYQNGGSIGGRSDDGPPYSESSYASSSGNRGGREMKEKTSPMSPYQPIQKVGSPTSAGIDIIRKVSSKGAGVGRLTALPYSTKPRGRAPSPSINSTYDPRGRTSSSDRTKIRSGSKSR